VELENGISGLHSAKEIFVPVQRQVGIVPALQQQLPAPECDRLVDLPEDLLEPEHVPFSRSDRTVEGAEITAGDADIRVVDVAVDDVADDSVRMLARAHGIGKPAKEGGRRVQIEVERLGSIEPAAAPHLVREFLNRHR
jgi:hypothetical protein